MTASAMGMGRRLKPRTTLVHVLGLTVAVVLVHFLPMVMMNDAASLSLMTTITSNTDTNCQAQGSSSTPTTSFSSSLSSDINWTQRIHDKRQWLEFILSSLPQETVQKPRLHHFNGTTGLQSNLCEEVSAELEDSWVIHSPFGQATTAKDPQKARQPSFNHTPAQQSNEQPSSIQTKPHKHAIVIPYRHRFYHLKRFIDYMDYFFYYHYKKDRKQPEHEFSLFIVEQRDNELFNRALLMNAGLDHISADTECVTIHDVDLIPSMYDNPFYHSCSYPLHLAVKNQNKAFGMPFPHFAGGVMTIHQQHWASIGQSNARMGCGGH